MSGGRDVGSWLAIVTSWHFLLAQSSLAECSVDVLAAPGLAG